MTLSEDELKEKAFIWVYDSKTISKCLDRARFVRDKLKEKYN